MCLSHIHTCSLVTLGPQTFNMVRTPKIHPFQIMVLHIKATIKILDT
jgi:hypothetical protein